MRISCPQQLMRDTVTVEKSEERAFVERSTPPTG